MGYVRLGWRKPGGRPTFAVVRGVTGNTILTIPGLETATQYEVRAYLMPTQAFHLYGGGASASAGAVIPEVSPAGKWTGNLVSGGLGKSQAIMLQTSASPHLPPPSPTPEPTPLPTPVGTIRPSPTQELEEELETDTDNDDTDTPTPDTPTPDTPDTPESDSDENS